LGDGVRDKIPPLAFDGSMRNDWSIEWCIHAIRE
jgi:hypothetical protein